MKKVGSRLPGGLPQLLRAKNTPNLEAAQLWIAAPKDLQFIGLNLPQNVVETEGLGFRLDLHVLQVE